MSQVEEGKEEEEEQILDNETKDSAAEDDEQPSNVSAEGIASHQDVPYGGQENDVDVEAADNLSTVASKKSNKKGNKKVTNGNTENADESTTNGKKAKKGKDAASKKSNKDKKQPLEDNAQVVDPEVSQPVVIEETRNQENSDLQTRLTQALEENQELEDKYNRLLGKLASIRTNLGDRLKQDAEELAEARATIETLQEQNGAFEGQLKSLNKEVDILKDEKETLVRDFSNIRDRLNIAQQNWAREREEFENSELYLREEYEATKKSMQDWEVLAMEESSVKKALREKCDDLEEQLAAQKDSQQILTIQRDKDYNTIETLRRTLDETQTARKAELRELVENTQSQIEGLTHEKADLVMKYQESQIKVESALQQIKQSSHFEAEVKEKSLLIGKLRHEAVILNEHLTKALRMLKRGNQQDTVDRQLVTNLLLSFLSLPRGDAKRYEVLQLIASFLNWTDVRILPDKEQRESAGLARPGTSSLTTSSTGSMRSPSVSGFFRARTPSNSGLESPSNNKDSLAELWTAFLDHEVNQETLKPP